MKLVTLTTASFALMLAATASAADCPIAVESAFDLEEAEVVALYDCLKEKMAEGYASQGDAVGSTFRSWAVTAHRPAVAGAHAERLLLTFANDIAAEEYLKFAEEGVQMPVGSVLAKESITLDAAKKTARPGPLFIMTKLAPGAAPEAGDWLYAGLQPNGNPFGVSQSFCHDCHSAWEDQDSLAYPVEEVRLGN